MATPTTNTNSASSTTRDITTTINLTNNSVMWKFSDGTSLEIFADRLTSDLQTMAMLHGLKQKIGDKAAMSAGAALADKYDAMQSTITQLLDGNWNKPRGNGESQPRTGLWLTVLSRMYPAKPIADLRTYIEGLSGEQFAALKLNPKVAAMADTIRAERANISSIDTDSLLAELDDIA